MIDLAEMYLGEEETRADCFLRDKGKNRLNTTLPPELTTFRTFVCYTTLVFIRQMGLLTLFDFAFACFRTYLAYRQRLRDLCFVI